MADNIFAVTSGVAACDAVADPLTKVHHNYWTGTPSDSHCRSPGSGDVYGTYAALGFAAHPFASSTKDSFPTSSWFRIGSSSQASKKGIAVSDTYLAEADWQWVLDQRSWKADCQSEQISSADFVKELSTDYCGRSRPSDAPSIGAFESSSEQAPSYKLMVE